jgi:lauroyl/myristoyl acyltransferase
LDSGFDARENTPTAPVAADTLDRLAPLWCRVLEVDQAGPDDDFIMRGGDSLSAATLFAEIGAVFGVSLPVEAVDDEGATLAGMAALIDRLAAEKEHSRNDDRTTVLELTEIAVDTGDRPHNDLPPETPLFDRRDLAALVKLVALAPLGFIPGAAARASACRMIARALIALRPTREDYLKDVLPRLDVPMTETEFETGILTSTYETFVETWRDLLPWDRPRTARLCGGEHLEAARAAGRGVILWNCGAGPASRAALRCIAGTGLSLLHTWSYDHPFSPSWFARTFLNPFFNRIENRYLEETVIVHENNTIEVMQLLGNHLAAGKAVRMPANAAFSNPYELPLLGGTFYLGLGAPTLALLHDAVLLPTFCLPDGAGGYEMIVEAPLNDGSEPPTADAARALGRRYTEILEAYLKRHPLMWRNWYLPITWRPGAPARTHPENGAGA